jgi:hypothetical protein
MALEIIFKEYTSVILRIMLFFDMLPFYFTVRQFLTIPHEREVIIKIHGVPQIILMLSKLIICFLRRIG